MTTDGTSSLGDNTRWKLKVELVWRASSVFRNWHQWNLGLMALGEDPEVLDEDALWMAPAGEVMGHMRDLCAAHLPKWHSPGPFHAPGSLGGGQWQTQCRPIPLVISTNLNVACRISASSPWSRRGWKLNYWPCGWTQSRPSTSWNLNKNFGYWSLGELPWLAILWVLPEKEVTPSRIPPGEHDRNFCIWTPSRPVPLHFGCFWFFAIINL